MQNRKNKLHSTWNHLREIVLPHYNRIISRYNFKTRENNVMYFEIVCVAALDFNNAKSYDEMNIF